MKHALLLFLLVPLHAFAQYRPMYTPARPSYTPRYTTSPSSSTNSLYKPNSPYQVQMRQQQYAHQQFQQFQAQQRLQMQDWSNRQSQAYWQRLHQQQQMLLYRQTPAQLAAAQATQQKAEQQANEKLAHLAQEQQRKQSEHPAQDAQQAAAQQREDARQLKQLAVRNYQNVFLPGQVLAAMQSQLPSAQAQQNVQALTQELLRNAWWKQQPGAQLADKLAAHSATLAALTHELRGAEPAAAAPTALAPGQLDALLAADSFDQQAASQLLHRAAQADKRTASTALAEAIEQFASAAALPGQASDQKALRKQVQASVKRVNTELARYQARVGKSGQLFETQRTIAQATAGYLAKSEGGPK